MKSALIKSTAVAATALIAAIVPMVSLNAASDTPWGPSRTTLTLNGNSTHGFDHVQFNSIVNNPNYGDERTFFDSKDSANTASGGFTDTNQVKAGEIITLRTYVHNNADDSLNASGKGIAKNTKVTIQLPTGTATSLRATSIISADNATPGSVFDTTDFQDSNMPFSLSYVPGSAVSYTNAQPKGMKLNDSIVTTGAQIGYDKADGNVPGCFQYTSIVTVQVKVNAPAASLTKQTTTVGSTNWQSNISAKAGDTTAWLLTVKNTSDKTDLKSPTILDQMPAHLKLVPGSVTYISSDMTKTLDDSALFKGGQNLPDMAPGAVIYIKYRTTVLSDFAATDCNDTIKNIAVLSGLGITPIYANATETVAHTCTTPTPTPTPTPNTPAPTPTPTVTTTTLPDTGAEAGLAGLGGLGAVAYAGRAYLGSKKSLIDSLRK